MSNATGDATGDARIPPGYVPLRFTAHRGASLVGRLIRWVTDGEVNHVAYLHDDGRLTEAREGRGVVCERTVADAVRDGDRVTVLVAWVPPEAKAAAEAVAAGAVAAGWGYDYAGVFRFVTRRRTEPHPTRRFCSHFATELARAAGVPVSREPAHKVHPQDFYESTDLCACPDCFSAAARALAPVRTPAAGAAAAAEMAGVTA